MSFGQTAGLFQLFSLPGEIQSGAEARQEACTWQTPQLLAFTESKAPALSLRGESSSLHTVFTPVIPAGVSQIWSAQFWPPFLPCKQTDGLSGLASLALFLPGSGFNVIEEILFQKEPSALYLWIQASLDVAPWASTAGEGWGKKFGALRPCLHCWLETWLQLK